jgi:hypothetical protein
MSEMIHELELASGKKVWFRDMVMGDKDAAIDLAGTKVQDSSNSIGIAYHLSKELIKLTMVGMADKEGEPKKLSANDKEELGKHFTNGEFNQIQDWYGKNMVGAQVADPKHQMTANPFG